MCFWRHQDSLEQLTRQEKSDDLMSAEAIVSAQLILLIQSSLLIQKLSSWF